MRPALKHVIATIFPVLSLATPVVAGPPDEYSFLGNLGYKGPIQEKFALSRSQWEAFVARALSFGDAELTGSPKTGLGLVLKEPCGGFDQTVLIYGDNNAKPNAMQVTLGLYGDCVPPSLLTDAGVKAAFAKTKQDILPEYTASGDFKRTESGLVIVLTISEASPAQRRPR